MYMKTLTVLLILTANISFGQVLKEDFRKLETEKLNKTLIIHSMFTAFSTAEYVLSMYDDTKLGSQKFYIPVMLSTHALFSVLEIKHSNRIGKNSIKPPFWDK